MEQIRFLPNGFSWNLIFEIFPKICWANCSFIWNLTKITGTWHEVRCTLVIISRLIRLRMTNVLERRCTKNQYKHFMFSNTLFRKSCCYETMYKNMVQPDRPHSAIWCIRIACWIPTTINTHSEQVMLVPFPLQQWFQERPSSLRYTYNACLVDVWFITNKLCKLMYCDLSEDIEVVD
jgi:hypothetical protein